jgi:uroporphyrin-3 C-methyltransferase
MVFLIAWFFLVSFDNSKETLLVEQKLQSQIDSLNAQLTQLKQQVADLPSPQPPISIAPLTNRVDELSDQQQQIEQDITALAQQIPSPQPLHDEDWKLAEIRYLLTIAQHRLQLMDDIQGALAALTAADNRLSRFNHLLLLPVRSQLFKEIKQLQTFVAPDIEGLVVKLAQYGAQIDELPLLQNTYQKSVALTTVPQTSELGEDNESEESWQQTIWKELKQLVVIRHNEEAETGFLTPKQQQFIKQSLYLKLEIARAFLLRRDSDNFTSALQVVQEWLNRYYDKNSSAVQVLQQDLMKMQTIDLTPPLPDISQSLELLQGLTH